jgi:hypothetical protein
MAMQPHPDQLPSPEVDQPHIEYAPEPDKLGHLRRKMSARFNQELYELMDKAQCEELSSALVAFFIFTLMLFSSAACIQAIEAPTERMMSERSALDWDARRDARDAIIAGLNDSLPGNSTARANMSLLVAELEAALGPRPEEGNQNWTFIGDPLSRSALLNLARHLPPTSPSHVGLLTFAESHWRRQAPSTLCSLSSRR